MISFDDITGTTSPEVVTSLDQVKLPCTEIVANDGDIVQPMSRTSRLLFKEIWACKDIN